LIDVSLMGYVSLSGALGCPGEGQQEFNFAGPVGALSLHPMVRIRLGSAVMSPATRFHLLQSVSEAFGLIPRRWVKRGGHTRVEKTSDEGSMTLFGSAAVNVLAVCISMNSSRDVRESRCTFSGLERHKVVVQKARLSTKDREG
jgi:hypothetical protein